MSFTRELGRSDGYRVVQDRTTGAAWSEPIGSGAHRASDPFDRGSGGNHSSYNASPAHASPGYSSPYGGPESAHVAAAAAKALEVPAAELKRVNQLLEQTTAKLATSTQVLQASTASLKAGTQGLKSDSQKLRELADRREAHFKLAQMPYQQYISETARVMLNDRILRSYIVQDPALVAEVLARADRVVEALPSTWSAEAVAEFKARQDAVIAGSKSGAAVNSHKAHPDQKHHHPHEHSVAGEVLHTAAESLGSVHAAGGHLPKKVELIGKVAVALGDMLNNPTAPVAETLVCETAVNLLKETVDVAGAVTVSSVAVEIPVAVPVVAVAALRTMQKVTAPVASELKQACHDTFELLHEKTSD